MPKRSQGQRETHDFYCISCGKKGIPLMRPVYNRKGKSHLKRLYCPNCRHTVNHLECTTLAEVEEFKAKFEAGEYIEEARRELSFEEHRLDCYGRIARLG